MRTKLVIEISTFAEKSIFSLKCSSFGDYYIFKRPPMVLMIKDTHLFKMH